MFYDPEAFVEPVRDIRFFPRQGDYDDYAPFTLEHCNQTIFTGEDGRATEVSPGTTIQYTVRDLYDRPWARIWEEYFEDGMERPETERPRRRTNSAGSGESGDRRWSDGCTA